MSVFIVNSGQVFRLVFVDCDSQIRSSGFAAMSASTYSAMAQRHPSWTIAWGALATDLRVGLSAAGFDDALIWGGIFLGTDPDEDLERARGLLRAFSLEGDDLEERAEACRNLGYATRGLTSAWAAQVARVPDCQLALDAVHRQKRARQETEGLQQTRLQAQPPPTEQGPWKGKAYRRLEAQGAPRAGNG